jgi:hypothetical protein
MKLKIVIEDQTEISCVVSKNEILDLLLPKIKEAIKDRLTLLPTIVVRNMTSGCDNCGCSANMDEIYVTIDIVKGGQVG